MIKYFNFLIDLEVKSHYKENYLVMSTSFPNLLGDFSKKQINEIRLLFLTCILIEEKKLVLFLV
jgi:hypothetical protein